MSSETDMPPSFRKVNYSLRPAKHTERRMFCDVFRRLSAFHPLREYTYVGFGGIEFSDFILFHKNLGIRDMISLEQPGAGQRVDANKPFNTIKVIHKNSSAALPSLKWKYPHILWLDYDDPLNMNIFSDVRTVANRASSGTALAFSFQCENAFRADSEDSTEENVLEKFTAVFGRDKVPTDVQVDDLEGWNIGPLGRRMLMAEIEESLSTRNTATADEKEHLEFYAICSIRYEDNAKMYSVVGIFFSKADQERLNNCEFDRLEFIQTPDKSVHIEVPTLTLREIKMLERQLPLKDGESLKSDYIPKSDAEKFAKLYRYLPNFSVLEN